MLSLLALLLKQHMRYTYLYRFILPIKKTPYVLRYSSTGASEVISCHIIADDFSNTGQWGNGYKLDKHQYAILDKIDDLFLQKKSLCLSPENTWPSLFSKQSQVIQYQLIKSADRIFDIDIQNQQSTGNERAISFPLIPLFKDTFSIVESETDAPWAGFFMSRFSPHDSVVCYAHIKKEAWLKSAEASTDRDLLVEWELKLDKEGAIKKVNLIFPACIDKKSWVKNGPERYKPQRTAFLPRTADFKHADKRIKSEVTTSFMDNKLSSLILGVSITGLSMGSIATVITGISVGIGLPAAAEYAICIGGMSITAAGIANLILSIHTYEDSLPDNQTNPCLTGYQWRYRKNNKSGIFNQFIKELTETPYNKGFYQQAMKQAVLTEGSAITTQPGATADQPVSPPPIYSHDREKRGSETFDPQKSSSPSTHFMRIETPFKRLR